MWKKEYVLEEVGWSVKEEQESTFCRKIKSNERRNTEGEEGEDEGGGGEKRRMMVASEDDQTKQKKKQGGNGPSYIPSVRAVKIAE